MHVVTGSEIPSCNWANTPLQLCVVTSQDSPHTDRAPHSRLVLSLWQVADLPVHASAPVGARVCRVPSTPWLYSWLEPLGDTTLIQTSTWFPNRTPCSCLSPLLSKIPFICNENQNQKPNPTIRTGNEALFKSSVDTYISCPVLSHKLCSFTYFHPGLVFVLLGFFSYEHHACSFNY